ncbi:MAG TPA: Spy/CpxP family protein refolding chaperone [Thauera sp.]|jgi:protein CpxP|nr:Spy/CpxP family protein refolding chaperone [Thauera sp.]HRA80424.1 Spy/CpxP family protein refolding chaperone [Thauera sp.]
MKTWIKTSIAAALITTGALGTSAALAWGGHCDGAGPVGNKGGWSQMAPEQMKAKMTQRAEVHMARLELALVLQPDQKPAFETFKADMKARAGRMATAMAERRAATQPTTAIERMQRMEDMGKLRQAEMAEARKTVEVFYATLSDPQKTVFDAEFQKMGRKGGKDGPGMRDGGGMGPGRG